jgi:hypothetical protein
MPTAKMLAATIKTNGFLVLAVIALMLVINKGKAS